MGDVVGLMKDFQEVIDEKDAAEKAMRMLEGQFTLDDFLEQMRMIQKMGSIKDLIAKMPGMGDMLPPGANVDDSELVRVEAIIQSFTKMERRDPYALIRETSRVARIAEGLGQPEAQVQELVQKFLFMKQMMEGLGQNMGMMGRVPGMKNVAMAKQLRKQMAQGGGIPGMRGMGTGHAGLGLPGMPGMGSPGMGCREGAGAGTARRPDQNADAVRVGAERQEGPEKARKGSRRKSRR